MHKGQNWLKIKGATAMDIEETRIKEPAPSMNLDTEEESLENGASMAMANQSQTTKGKTSLHHFDKSGF